MTAIQDQEKTVTFLNTVCQRGRDYSPFASLEAAQERRDSEEATLVAMKISAMYSDEALLANAAATTLPGPRRIAEALMTVPEDARSLVSRSATRRTNMTGSRYSDACYLEAAAWLRGSLTEDSHALAAERMGF